MSTEAMKLALDALMESVGLVQHEYDSNWRHGIPTRAAQLTAERAVLDDHKDAIEALRRALSAQPPQCPHGGGQCGVGRYCEPCPNVGGTSQPPAPSVPDGWRLVPVEPTEAMLRPFYQCPPDELKLAWAAMLIIANRNAPPPVRERLTDERIESLWYDAQRAWGEQTSVHPDEHVLFARLLERALIGGEG